jgi:hypothetical protein
VIPVYHVTNIYIECTSTDIYNSPVWQRGKSQDFCVMVIVVVSSNPTQGQFFFDEYDTYGGLSFAYNMLNMYFRALVL